ncbi:MAG: hypothetical protein ACK53Y_03370, partial [bacterium]
MQGLDNLNRDLQDSQFNLKNRSANRNQPLFGTEGMSTGDTKILQNDSSQCDMSIYSSQSAGRENLFGKTSIVTAKLLALSLP